MNPSNILMVILIIVIIADIILEKIFRKSTKEIHKLKEDIVDMIELYINIDPKVLHDKIDDLIDRYTEQYMFDNGLLTDVTNNYLGEKVINDMIHDITRNILSDMSEMCKTYIRLLIHVDDTINNEEMIYEENVTRFIFNKVKVKVLDISVNYNSEEE